jgi:hypothetical protein
MESPKPLLAQWREANHDAPVAEQSLFEASLLYLRGHGPMPTDEDLRAVKHKRAVAGSLLKQALAQFGSADPPSRHCRQHRQTSLRSTDG